jgi:GH35 family endo-1,4-beta-xylanase
MCAWNGRALREEVATIEVFAKLGVKVNITELDVDVLPKVKKELMVDVSKSVESIRILRRCRKVCNKSW